MVIKCVKQEHSSSKELSSLMETFKEMVNLCIQIGLEENISTLKRFSSLHYRDLSKFQTLSYYKLTAMSHAMGQLSRMKYYKRKGIRTTKPIICNPFLISYRRFKINEMLLSIPIGDDKWVHIQLNRHTQEILSDKSLSIRSFLITPKALSIFFRKEVEEIKPELAIGIDRNLRNVTISTPNQTIMYKTNKLLSIKENTSHVLASFKRFDVRVKKHYQKLLGSRRSRRTEHFLHKISKDIVQKAVESKSMIVFEDLKGIRKLYRKGNGQGNKYRRKLNSWSFYELQRQIEYKAAWNGIPVKFVDPKRTSQLCPICGDRLQEDRFHRRKLLCINCKKSMDRDVVASMNIAYKGWSRFCHPRGLSDEVMKRNVENFQPLILAVDGSKLVSVKK